MSFDLSSCLWNNPTFFFCVCVCRDEHSNDADEAHSTRTKSHTEPRSPRKRGNTHTADLAGWNPVVLHSAWGRDQRSPPTLRGRGFFPSLKFFLITICSNLLNYNLLFFFLLQDNNNILFLAENLRIPRNLYEPIAEIADYKKYISALLMILFDRETLATHSLQGRRGAGDECHKPQLPPDILKGIIGKKKSTELFITLRRHRVENQTSVLFFLLLQTTCRPSLVWTAAK